MGQKASKTSQQPATSSQSRGRRSCMQFADCENKTLKHRSQYIHSTDIPPYIDCSDRPPCWYWETCKRQDGSEHMAKYLHPWELIDEVRTVLIGKTGAGKSLSCNTLLGEEKFQSVLGFQSDTSSCQYDYVNYQGTKYMIVDTPGIFDTRVKKDQNAIELLKCLSICAPGPHVFLITIAIGHGRYTVEDETTVELCRKVLGDGMLNHAVVLFTCGDKLIEENMTEEELLNNSPETLKKLIKDCGGRTFIINNKTSREHRTNQARDLMMKISTWGLDKTAYEDKHGLFKKIEGIFMKEQLENNTSRDEIKQSIMRNLRKAKPIMKTIITAIGPMIGEIPHPYAQGISKVMTVVTPMLIIPLLDHWVDDDIKETPDG